MMITVLSTVVLDVSLAAAIDQRKELILMNIGIVNQNVRSVRGKQISLVLRIPII